MTHQPQFQRILVIKFRAIGDVLLSSVVLANLRAAYPAATIDMLTDRMCADVIGGNPVLASVIAFDSRHESGLGLVRRIRNRHYDLVIDLFGNPRSAIVARLSGARQRVGYRFGWRRFCYTAVVEPRGNEVHNTEFNLDALRALKIPILSREISIALDDDAEHVADVFIRDAALTGRFLLALNPGGGWSSKRWPIEYFAQLGDRLSEDLNAVIAIVWGPAERLQAERIRDLMRSPCVLFPQTTLKQLASILRRCSLLVTNDSGPMHMAAAMGIPIVALFGPTSSELQGPYHTAHTVVQNHRLVCLGCNFTTCPIGNPCMTELQPSDVFEECKKFLIHHRLIEVDGRAV